MLQILPVLLHAIMRWLLAGCCGLALINISVAMNPAVPITQKPRFYGVRTRHDVSIVCLSNPSLQFTEVRWYKADRYDAEVGSRRQIPAGPKFEFSSSNRSNLNFLFVHGVELEDSGVYFCMLNNTWGPGTALQVARPFDLSKALYRTKMKDGLIILQGLVLAGCIAAILLRKRQLLRKTKDIIYEEPENDHIYEGLAIETCGGGLYEELSVYAEADVGEAPWE